MLIFEKLYNKYLKYYLIRESINEVPRKVLGMFTDIKDIPDELPYGFWVDRSGNFIPVGYTAHQRVGGDIINAGMLYLKKKGIVERYPSWEYKYLFDMGWMRVVSDHYSDNVAYEMGATHTPTTSQMKFLNFCKDLYDRIGILKT